MKSIFFTIAFMILTYMAFGTTGVWILLFLPEIVFLLFLIVIKVNEKKENIPAQTQTLPIATPKTKETYSIKKRDFFANPYKE